MNSYPDLQKRAFVNVAYYYSNNACEIIRVAGYPTGLFGLHDIKRKAISIFRRKYPLFNVNNVRML